VVVRPVTAAAGGWDGGAERGAEGAGSFEYEVGLDDKVGRPDGGGAMELGRVLAVGLCIVGIL
jgi:hypothetical protein